MNRRECCPSCGNKRLRLACPTPGDVVVCTSCAAALLVGHNLELRELTQDALGFLCDADRRAAYALNSGGVA